MNASSAAISQEARYRLLIDAITDYAIYMLDPGGRISSWNAGARRFKGYEESEIIGEHFSRFYTPEDCAAGLPEKALAVARSEQRFETEGWRVRKDGSRFWTHVVIDPIWSTSGELVGYAKITRDLTQKKAGEAAIKHSEQQFRLLVQGVTDYAIYMLQPDGRVASWNAGAERIKGYSAVEIVGQHFSRFYPEEDRLRGEPERGLQTAASEGRFEKEGWRIRKDGSRFWASIVIDAIRDDQGQLVGFAKVTRDITEKRESQRALDEAREALFQSQKIEAIGQLTGGVAHDFNNLLMVILSSLELLRKRLPQDDKLLSLINSAEQASRRGASLTQRMLTFARRQELDVKPIHPADLIRGMSDLLQRSLGPAIRVETRFPLGLSPVLADESHLEVALLNLALNARDAMPKGGELVIGARQEVVRTDHILGLSPGSYVCISVADEGEGMDADTLKRATEPFFTTKGVGKGTGLGLSMVHGLAEQSGGRLRLESRPGAGTTAELWLPAARADDLVVQEEVGKPNPATPSTSPLRILAVDDDPLVLMNTAAMLEDEGHTVVEAGSGAEALRLLRGGDKFDLLITDHAMPKMTGLELLETVGLEFGELPAIVATGYADLSEWTKAKLPRLSKPFTQAQLAQAIEEAMRQVR